MASDKDIPDISSLGESWEGHTGEQVEKFIKDILASKAGVFYEDEDNNRYLVFASEETRDEYLEDPEKTDLVLSVITAGGGAGGGYNLSVNLLSPYYMTALPGADGTYIEFTFDITNNAGLPTDDDILVTYTFRWNSVVKTVTQKYVSGQRVRFAVDDYVGESGITNISVKITGATSLATTSFAVVYSRVDLRLTDEFKTGNSYNLISNPNSVLEIPYTLVGMGLKVMEWYIDGQKQPLSKDDDEVTEQTSTRTKYISASGLTEGVHSLQFRAYTTVNGENFYSQTIYREFAVYRAENNSRVMLMIGATLDTGTIVTPDQTLTLDNITQYLPYTIKIGVFSPSNAASNIVEVYLGTTLQATLDMANGEEQEHTFIATDTSVKTIKLTHATNERDIAVDIAETSSTLTEITAGLSLNLKAIGKTNSSPDKASWTYKGITTVFTGFKWTEQSGWADDKLVMSDGASISVSHAPLSGDVTSTGKTLEFEFSTSNVSDDDAVICDLRNGSTGLLITASEATLTSAAGTKVSVKYKSEENIRIAFVVNPKSGATNKRLVFIYVNGILSGAANYAESDNFRVTENLSITSSEYADVRIKELRFYDTALSSDQILNNYTLYRDTVAEMLRIYDRNDIYAEGSSEFSTDILSSQLPIVIITGNVPALEATTDKNLQIEVDVEYINIQEPELSFKMTKAALRPQGTSSMSYPKKNFRLYTKKLSDTTLYDSNGNVVPNKLYSFKAGSQPVGCWCFKADYAESSGTHNTGIARLWNDAMKNAQIGQAHPLQTMAQAAAIQHGYGYDVRTTIDGFPVLMFYRLNANSPLVFIGKYNFNNDKSTESVFGFCDIPGFNDDNVECWEVLNNGHHLALFQDVKNWDAEWADAFEGRYPDGNTDTTVLRAFASWMATVTQSSFATQKWSHLDVYKVAAYYVYLMRFGAVDQVVKNAMFTTEDGVHWFYINYDNDTVNGLRNDGLLIYPPTIDRQTIDPTTTDVYAYAGHDSRLWNMLEADTEFMQIVAEVDSALYTAGLSYANVIKIFDDEQSDKWCERVYNQDSQYKYIGPYNNNGINNLFMLQGSRRSHRRYWLSRRFSWMDSKFVSGAYKDNVFEVKLAGAPIGLQFSIVSGFHMNYGYGVNNVPVQYGITLQKNESHTFTTQAVLNVGDPLRIYAAPNIKEIDIHSLRQYLTQISISGVLSSDLGTKLEKLIMGSDSTTDVNNALSGLSGIGNAKKLKHLDIRGYKGINVLDLSGNMRLTTLLASNSGLASLTLAPGSPVTRIDLPSTIQIVELHNLPLLESSGLTVAGNFSNVTTLKITGCGSLDTKDIVDTWLANKTTEHAQCSVEIDGIDWTGVDPAWLVQFGNMLNVTFKGAVQITSISESLAEQLVAVFGASCFNASAEFYVKLPAGSAMLAGPSTVHEERSYQYAAIMDNIVGDISFSVAPADRQRIDISPTGLLTIGTDPTPLSIVVRASSRDAGNNLVQVAKAVVIQPHTYPTANDISIEGDSVLTKNGSAAYSLQIEGEPYTGAFSIEWSLEKGEGVGASLEPNGRACTLLLTSMVFGESLKLKATVKKAMGEVITVKELDILMIDSVVIMSEQSNAPMMAFMYQMGYAANASYMTQAEAEACTSLSLNSLANSVEDISEVTFDEFQYFANVVDFESCPTKMKSISLPHITFKYSNGSSDRSTNQIIADTINLPFCTTIELGDEFLAPASKQIAFECDNFNAPALKRIVSTATYRDSSQTHILVYRVKSINVPELEEIDFSEDESKQLVAFFMLHPDIFGGEILFPKLKRFVGNISMPAVRYLTYHPANKSQKYTYDLRLPALQEMYHNHVLMHIAWNGVSSEIKVYIGGALVMPSSLDKICRDSNVKNALYEIDAPNATGEVTISGSIVTKVTLPKCNLDISSDVTYLESIACFTFSDSRALMKSRLSYLHTIYIYSPTAPEITDVSSAIGYSAIYTQKMLYLKQDATGYDAEIWNKAPLSNYTKSFTL